MCHTLQLIVSHLTRQSCQDTIQLLLLVRRQCGLLGLLRPLWCELLWSTQQLLQLAGGILLELRATPRPTKFSSCCQKSVSCLTCLPLRIWPESLLLPGTKASETRPH
jgi:hypothetical protein